MPAEDGLLEAGARIRDHSSISDRVRVDGPERMLTGGARRVRHSDFDAISAAVASGGFTAASPLRSGPFLLEAAGVGLGDGAVLAGRNSPLLVQGALPADTVWAVLPLGRDGPVLINGRAAGPNTVAVFGPGALHEAANHRDAGWAFVALRAALADRHLELPARSPLLRRGAHALLACDPEAWRRTASAPAVGGGGGSARSGGVRGRGGPAFPPVGGARGRAGPAVRRPRWEAGADPVFPVGPAAPGPRPGGPLAGTPRARTDRRPTLRRRSAHRPRAWDGPSARPSG